MKMIMQVFLSLAVVATALFVVVTASFDAATANWAYGAIGFVLGYWLESPK
jgi:hypothetical protein